MWSADGFRTSSYSENGPHCVEVRDTRNRDQGCLSFPAAEWSAFLRGVDAL